MIATILRGCIGIVACMLFGEAVAAEATPDERKQEIQRIEVGATPAALARKKRSDALLRKQGVPVNESLPAIEDETRVRKRTREEVAYRALSLLVVAIKGNGLEDGKINTLVATYGLEPHLSPDERAFIRNPKPTDQERAQFSWRYEAAWVLLWALGYVEELGMPSASCEVDVAVKLLLDHTSAQFVADAKLRPLSDIVEQADRIYRYHWAVVDARVTQGKDTGLDTDVTIERHHALNWLIGYMAAEWDDVSTDT